MIFYRLKDTVEPNSNFINLRGNYFNKGKYKGIEVDRAPIDSSRLGLFFSPIKELNMDILKSFGDKIKIIKIIKNKTLF